MPRLPGAQLEQMVAILHHAIERHRFLVELVAAGLDARQIEDFVDEVEEVHAGTVNVAGVVLVHRHRVRAENLALHHLREAEDGVERRAQLVTHLREEPRFGDVGGFGAAARLVGNRLRLLELADQCVLFRARFERRQRRRVEPIGEQRKITLRRQRHDGEDVIVQRALEDEIERDGDGDRQGERQHRDRQARRQHARYRHHQQHDEQHERAGLLVDAERMDEDEGPRHAEEQIEQDEAQPPGAQDSVLPGGSSRNCRQVRMITRWMMSAPPVQTPGVERPVHRPTDSPMVTTSSRITSDPDSRFCANWRSNS